MSPDERDTEQLYAIWRYCKRALRTANKFENSFEAFCADETFQDAVSLCIIQIGEAANRLSDQFKLERPEVKWVRIYRMRNHLVHGYDMFDAEIAWDALNNYIPALETFCAEELEKRGEL